MGADQRRLMRKWHCEWRRGHSCKWTIVLFDIEQGGIIAMLIWAALILYLVASMIAGMCSHHNGGAIFALNLLLGWTVLGWVAAFVWACQCREAAF